MRITDNEQRVVKDDALESISFNDNVTDATFDATRIENVRKTKDR